MKYLINLLFLLGAAFFLGGCSDDDDPVDAPRLEVSESSLRFGSLATEQVIQVTSSEAWKIANIPDWLSVEPVSGQAGEYEVKVAVIENTTEVERKVRLVVQAGTENWNLPVYQLEKGVLEINEKEFIALYNHTSLKVPYRNFKGNLQRRGGLDNSPCYQGGNRPQPGFNFDSEQFQCYPGGYSLSEGHPE